ncbi:KIR-like protein [Plasmodium coatneyi]|uniref:KIR-like protein n=1 Tax=Plasmodium coatneyi TaxID=208452 RepID=A0A1B1DUW4_9APIC|nr:KIR-like protein [Plasmodium coatneyi]ANQ06568.1 KIR-like protein [Plasmodium coatneyi]
MSETAPAEPVDPQKKDTFPSYKDFYGIFESVRENKEDCKNGCRENTEIPQRLNGKIKESSDKIKGAICTACKMYKGEGTGDPSKREAYHFLYYWLGDKLPKSGNDDTNFQTDIKAICEAINKFCGTGGSGQCGIPCDNISGIDFRSRKTIFDFSYNFTTIEENIKECKFSDNSDWSSYRANVYSACTVMSIYCTTERGKTKSAAYCKELETKYAVPCKTAELVELHCQKVHELETERRNATETAQYTLSQLNDALSKANKAFSLSSAFGTLALMELPALAFFLYKYKPWSSLFGNHSGSSRGKRSTGREFDASTESASTITDSTDDSSTIGPTENSTTLRSVAHTRQPTRSSTSRGREKERGARAGTNRTSPSRQNISYGRM